ncbi:MAG: nuclease [Firmicutes bacterium]|nr:nuclease [Bacillota bacterium]
MIMKKPVIIVKSILLILTVVVFSGCSGDSNNAYKQAEVVRVVDGDTVVVSLNNGETEKVRLIGINTPESTTRHQPYGEEASKYTKVQLTGKTIYLEKDVSERDRYDRLLRIIWTEKPASINDEEIRNKMFNAKLVIEGYARVATYPPDVKYVDYFNKYDREARKSNRGLWAIDPNQDSEEKQPSTATGKIKGNINSDGEKIYHVPGGAYYERTEPEVWFETEKDALEAGFRRSKR